MLVNKASISAAFVTMNVLYNKAFAAAQPEYLKIAMHVPSTSGSEDYAWLSNFPKMRRWVGDKSKKQLKAFKYAIVNEDWEATVQVKRNDIEDDNLGIYAPQAQAVGTSSKLLPDEIVNEVVNSAFTGLCYDGQYFCDTDHPVGPEGSQVSVSNKITKKLNVATQAGAKASFGVGKTMMRQFKDDEGRSLKCKPTIFMVGPLLEDDAKTLMTAERLEDGKPNLYKGAAEVFVNDEIEDESWFLLDTSKPVKPFVYQERKKPTFVSQTDMNNDTVFNKAEYAYGTEARAAGGFGFWQLCVGSTGADA